MLVSKLQKYNKKVTDLIQHMNTTRFVISITQLITNVGQYAFKFYCHNMVNFTYFASERSKTITNFDSVQNFPC